MGLKFFKIINFILTWNHDLKRARTHLVKVGSE